MSDKSTVLFAFGNQKGGVGKSTLSMVFMNYLHKEFGERYTCSAVDADDLQRTFLGFRIRDLEIAREDDRGQKKSEVNLWKEVMEKENEYGLYHVIPVSSQFFREEYIDRYVGTVDFMAIDLPGTLKQPGVMESYSVVDVLFIPLNPFDADVESTYRFLELYAEVDKMRKEAGILPVEKYIVLSKFDRKLAFDREAFSKKFDVPILENVFSYSPAAFGRDSNTILRFKKSPTDKDTPFLMDEIFQILERRYNLVNGINS